MRDCLGNLILLNRMILRKWPVVISLTALSILSCKKTSSKSDLPDETIHSSDLQGRWEIGVTTIDVNGESPVIFPGETSRMLVPVVWEIHQDTLLLRTADDLVLHRWSKKPVVLEQNTVICEFAIESVESEELVVDWSRPRSVAWNVLWERPLISNPLEEPCPGEESKGSLRVVRNGEGELEYLEFVARVELGPEVPPSEDPTANEGCYPFYGPPSGSEPCPSVETSIMFSLSKVKDWTRTIHYEYRGAATSNGPMFGGSAFQTGSYEAVRRLPDSEDLQKIPARFNIWKQGAVHANSAEEAGRFAPAQCLPPLSGEPLFHCIERDVGDRICRCSNGGNTIVVAAEPVFTYSEVPAASEDEAGFYAPAQCEGSAYTCNGEGCVCSQSGEPVWKLTYRAGPLPEELEAGDGVVCPCDPSEEARWNCDPLQPAPCFYLLDGLTVMQPVEGGTYSFPLRYFERTLRPVVYHPGPGFPNRLKSTVTSVFREWSRVLDDAAWRASGCEGAGLERGIHFCPARPEYTTSGSDDEPGFQLLLFCPNNPRRDRDPEVCPDIATRINPGDIRHNLVEWIPSHGNAVPLSFTPHRMNPLTGEIRSASIFIYDVHFSRIAQQFGILAEVVTNYNRPLSDFFEIHQDDDEDPEPLTPPRRVDSDLRRPVPYNGGFGLDVLRSTQIEDWMMDNSILRTHAKTLVKAGFSKEEILDLTGADLEPGTPIRERVSPLTWLNPAYLRERIGIRYRHLEETMVYPDMAPFPLADHLGFSRFFYGSVARIVGELCGCDLSEFPQGCSDEQMDLTSRWEEDPLCMDKVTGEYENRLAAKLLSRAVGHNLGLKNNFKGSFDVLNYPDKYWEIRVESARQQGKRVLERFLQPVTEWEFFNGVESLMTGSVMDYTPAHLSKEHPPGRWEEAALNRLYAGFTPVYREIREEIPEGEGSPDPRAVLGALQARVETAWHTGLVMDGGGEVEPAIPTLSYFDPEHPQLTPRGVVNTHAWNRDFRPIRWIVKAEKEPGFPVVSNGLVSTAQWLERDEQSRPLIPFLFCSTQSLQKEPGCLYFDAGEEPFAIAKNTFNDYLNSVILARNVTHFSGHDDELWYPRRVVGLHLDNLFSMARLYETLGEYITRERFSDWGLTENDVNFKWTSFFLAARVGVLSPLERILTMPEETPFVDYPSWMDFQPVMDRWAEGDHLEWGVERTRIGTIHERAILLQMVGEKGDPTLWETFGSYEQATPPAEGPSAAGLLSKQVNALMTALLARHSEEIGGNACITEYGYIKYEPFSFNNIGKEPCSIIAEMHGSSMGFLGHVELPDHPLLALYEIVYGQNLWPYERSVFRATPEAEAMFAGCDDLAEDGCERVYFTDPFTNEEYLAAAYPAEYINETSVDVSVGSAMLQRGLELEDKWEDTLDLCGNPCEPGDEGYEEVEMARARLEDYVWRIEVMVELSQLLY